MDTNVIVVAFLAMIAAGGVFYAVAYPYMSGEARAAKRQAMLQASGPAKGGRPTDRVQDVAQRRKQVVDSLKEIEQRGLNKRASLEMRILRAGLSWTKSQFLMISVGLALACGVGAYIITRNPLIALPGLLVGGLGIPNFILSFLRKRRLKKFIIEFPNAVDIIIRGIKAGLPVGDCLRIIASETAEPVRGEFRQVVEATTVGLSIGEATERMVERVPVTESNFFSIVINIQQKSGGNLSEALGNLSRVLRERKKMQLKVKAMSAEAKASASIIGALPFLVSFMVYVSSPRYIELLWLTSTGRVVLVISGIWMLVGISVMKKMISFDM
jgi:tight adherence protein B